MTYLVADWMTPDPVCVLDLAPLSTAATLMIRHRFRHLPVIARDGRLLGLADDASVFGRGELREGRWFVHDDRDASLVVADVDFAAPIVIRPGDPVTAALAPMVEAGEDCAVVVDDQRRPVGVLTAHDAVRHAPTVLPAGLDTAHLASSPVLTARLDQPVASALDTLRAHGRRHLVVLDRDRPVAVISWRDLVEQGWDRRPTLPLSEAVDAGAVEAVGVGAPLQEVAERMVLQKVGCLPVIDGAGRLAGLVSRTDLVQRMLAALG